MFNLKDTRKFFFKFEQEKNDNRHNLQIASIQTVLNIKSFRSKILFNYMNKSKYNQGHYKFAKKFVLSFINKVPEIAEDFAGEKQESEFIKVLRKGVPKS